MRIAFAVLALLVAAAFLSSAWLTRPVVQGRLDDSVFGELTIAPPDKAITLAVTRAGGVWLVTGIDRDGITGVDVSAASGQTFEDALQAYVALGEEGLRRLVGESTDSIGWSELGQPVAPRFPNVAVGTNYRAHAREVGLEEIPFLFPKLSRATAWDDPVPSGTRLDYEVELCVVPLEDYDTVQSAQLGYLLCGDYTERWTLVREIDLDGPMGRSGFPRAKGGEGRLPVGPLLVIPRDEDFYRQIELRLYLGETLRQRDLAANMVWSPKQILDRALQDCEPDYRNGEEKLRLTDCEAIPAGTLVLTGTPEGVLFQLGTLWNPWAYLRVGDEVTSFGTHLGFMRNVIMDDTR